MARRSISSALRKAVIERDRSICQCCYRSTEGPEVHHLLPVYLGGSDEISNLIVLCSTCHFHAPDEAEEFYLYQKKGGMGSCSIVASLLEAYKDSPFWDEMLLKDFAARVERLRIQRFEENWNEYQS